MVESPLEMPASDHRCQLAWVTSRVRALRLVLATASIARRWVTPHRGKLHAIVIVALCLGAQVRATAAPSRLAVSFSTSDVVISGLTPKGQVVLIGVAREPMGYYSRIKPFFELLEDPDGDGTTRYELKSANAWKSVWGVVDLRSGDFVVARPDRSPGRQIEFKGKGMGRGANGKLTKIEHEGQWLELMLVKPTGDVFHSLVVDGGPFDEDGRNDNVVNVSFEAFDLIRGKGARPDEYRVGDVLFVVNLDELSMVAVKVK